MTDPFQIPSPESKLLQQIHALGLGKFKAEDLIKRLQPALKEYFGRHREVNAISAGLLLKKLLGSHGTLKVEGTLDEVQRLQMRGRYDKSLRVWHYRVIDTAAPKPAAVPVPPPAQVVQ